MKLKVEKKKKQKKNYTNNEIKVWKNLRSMGKNEMKKYFYQMKCMRNLCALKL